MRVLLAMTTGTGVNFIAMQIAFNLWRSKWSSDGVLGKSPRILVVTDRKVLLYQAFEAFGVFNEGRHIINRDHLGLGRDIYFATYQTLLSKSNSVQDNLYKEYKQDFFDMIMLLSIPKDSQNLTEVLNYFSSAYHFGITSFYDRTEDTFAKVYFGEPVYEYTLAQATDDRRRR
jgi:type I restriction enzyme R subunit